MLKKNLWSPTKTLKAQPRSVCERCRLETGREDQQDQCQQDAARQPERPPGLPGIAIPGCLQTQWTPRDSAGMGSAGPDPALNSPLWFHFSFFLSSFSPLGLVLAPCYKEKFRIKTVGQFLKLRFLV